MSPLDVASLIACGVITGVGAVTNTAGVHAGECGRGDRGTRRRRAQCRAGRGAGRRFADRGAGSFRRTSARPALRFGATHTRSTRATPTSLQLIKEVNDGRLADWVFVTVGVKPAFDQANGLMKRGGAVVIVGVPPSGVTGASDQGFLASDEQRILGSKMGSARASASTFRASSRSVPADRAWKLDELISGRYKLEDINEAIASVRRGEALRNVIVF